MTKLLIASAILILSFSACSAYKTPAEMDVARIIKEESSYEGVRIDFIKVEKVLFEKKDGISKAKVRIGITALRNFYGYIKKNRRDFIPNVVFWRKGAYAVLDADAVLFFGKDKNWHLKEYD